MGLEKKIALNISKELSNKLSKKIAGQTIRWMQSQSTTIDLGCLENLWDDVCYQCQGGSRTYSWNQYDFAVVTYVISRLEELSEYEANAIWLQTEYAYDHLVDMEDGGVSIDSSFTPMNSSPYVDDIAKYIAHKYIYEQAASWHNDRLRQALGYD
ncbi:hypothetical protein [Psychrobacter cryohalolentis]|uniref:Uncharacterized protein n=1 Tax=Psychrobacter cryohalolentis (strain ATCC BAA-1226 / DSM 17306 / VKM B-2378 / K5) TaxID=335284 RepID=Q1Q864_PSYCK|nr:hypothetical protein [Psychrobacter cryohalolentis]ABE76139.1 hypothetical protein Pcryo_2362 [Psychrobacter cryohalolentis K5]ASE26316.1 hypothetical protein CEP87_06810 [Psychrobacter cryohalolentis]|tara:strand:- start:17707 stop:18171 length:465 start_codon:yes stop_codon:yes gene_type:complete